MVKLSKGETSRGAGSVEGYVPWHRLYLLPEPQGHGSFRPILLGARVACALTAAARGGGAWRGVPLAGAGAR